MTLADTAQPFIQSPLAVTLIGAACLAMITMAGAAIRIVIQLARIESNMAGMREEISNLKNDPDVMRWSNYGRATQALPISHGTPGVTL